MSRRATTPATTYGLIRRNPTHVIELLCTACKPEHRGADPLASDSKRVALLPVLTSPVKRGLKQVSHHIIRFSSVMLASLICLGLLSAPFAFGSTLPPNAHSLETCKTIAATISSASEVFYPGMPIWSCPFIYHRLYNSSTILRE